MINKYMTKHKHHIIPKHMGGTNDPHNILELSIEDHAEAHRLLYEKHGRWQDKLAWMGLSKLVPSAEIKYQAIKEFMSGPGNPMKGKPAANRGCKRPGVGGRKKGTKWSTQERINHENARSKDGYYDYLKTEERANRYRGENNPMYGKQGANANRKVYNNGIEERYFVEGEQDQGFILGRIKNSRNGIKKGLLWFNNGLINKQFREGQQPEGFNRGKLINKH